MNLDLHLFSTRGPLTFLRKPYDNPEHLSPLLRRRGLPVSLSCKTWAFPARSAAGFKACCSICIPAGILPGTPGFKDQKQIFGPRC